MKQVILRNSCIEITDYRLGDSETLEKYFKVYDPLRHCFDTLGMYYDEENEKLFLPRGIDLWFVKKHVGVKDHIVANYNPYQFFTKEAFLRYKPRDDEQFQALNFMCGLTEEFEENLYLPQLSVNLVTGKGKTYCSIATMCFFQMKSIVITGSTSLLNQWRENIKEYTNFEDEDIFMITGSSVMNMIAIGKSEKAKKASIYLVSHATIRSYANNYSWNTLNDVFVGLGVGIKFIDEAHTNFDNMLMMDFYTDVYKTYYVTATPKRSSRAEDRVYQLSIKNIPSVDLFNEDSDPHTDYIAIKWNSNPSSIQISKCHNVYGLNRIRYIDYVTKQPNFYKMMYIIMDMVLDFGGRALFYIGTNEALLRVYKWIGHNYPELLGDIGVFTSIVEKDKKLLEREKRIILSTTKSAGLGEHIEGLKTTVVLAEPFKSEVLARQSLGRTRDRDTNYIELVDLGFKQIKQFYNAKLQVFNKYALSTSDIMINQYELDIRSNRIKTERDKHIDMSPIRFHDDRFFIYDADDIEEVRTKLGLNNTEE